MKRLKLLLMFMHVFIGLASAQSVATTTRYNDSLQPALILQLPYSTSVTEGTILKKLNETGYDPQTKGALFWKKNKEDGFIIYHEVTLQQLAGQKLDLYFKIVRQSKKNKNYSTLFLMVNKGSKNFVSPTSDTTIFNAAKRFLNGFVSETGEYKLSLDIEAQEAAVTSAEKKLRQLEGKEVDLNKKIEGLKQDLITNKAEQENQKIEISNQKLKLEALKMKVGQ